MVPWRADQWLPGVGIGRGMAVGDSIRELFGMMEQFCVLIGVVVTQIYVQ